MIGYERALIDQIAVGDLPAAIRLLLPGIFVPTGRVEDRGAVLEIAGLAWIEVVACGEVCDGDGAGFAASKDVLRPVRVVRGSEGVKACGDDGLDVGQAHNLVDGFRVVGTNIGGKDAVEGVEVAAVDGKGVQTEGSADDGLGIWVWRGRERQLT